MKNRQVALLAALAFQYKWARSRNYVSPEEVIEVAKVFEDYLNYREPPIQDDPPPIPPRA